MGRGVRPRADYCVVILTGKSLVSFMSEVANQAFFTEETKRQIEAGKQLASMLKAQHTNPYQAILDLVAQCLNRDQGWQTYHRDALQDIGTVSPAELPSMTLAAAELHAWQHAFRGQYSAAAGAISDLIDKNGDLSAIDTGWYLQLQADYLHHEDQVTALEKQLKAHGLNPSLLKPATGGQLSQDTSQANGASICDLGLDGPIQ